jgi:hypothetical protein
MAGTVTSLPDFDAAQPRRALVVRGGWAGHQPVEATDLFIPFLVEHGFAVEVHADPAAYADTAFLAGVDLIVQCVTMGSIRAEELAGLRAAVEAGTGLAGWHGGIVDSYRGEPDYLQLVGGQFAAHPGRPPEERTGGAGDNFVAHAVTIIDPTHPITSGVPDFELVTEQYWMLTDGYIDVLATTTQRRRPGDPWHREVVSPAVWTRRWGAGRVFVATPGHDVDVLRDPNVNLIVGRGLLWASR